jgi:BolA family transcriptional regulator, general stress-responsive regulator
MRIQESMEKKIKAAVQPSVLKVVNESPQHHLHPAGETHFHVLVVANKFDKMSRLDRHRLINNLFEEEREMGLHALTIQAFADSEYDPTRPIEQSPMCRGVGK